MRLPHLLTTCMLLLLLSACSTTPKVAQDADRSTTPIQAAAADTALLNQRLQWGGVIVGTKNLADSTELEVLAYPLKKSGMPDVTAAPNGRFIAQHAGYLESADYATGRQLTVTGKLLEIRQGKVGEAAYQFPLLQADELVLWPRRNAGETKPKVNFGFGIGSGGRSWGGVGIGIGL
jgi:outer membrane lipoprotein